MRRTRSVARASKDSTSLEALRDRLAAAVDDPDQIERLAANARELRMVLAALAAQPGGAEVDEIDELKRRREARRRA